MEIIGIDTLVPYVPLDSKRENESIAKVYSQLFVRYLFADVSITGSDTSDNSIAQGVWKELLIEQLSQEMATNHNRVFGSQLSQIVVDREGRND